MRYFLLRTFFRALLVKSKTDNRRDYPLPHHFPTLPFLDLVKFLDVGALGVRSLTSRPGPGS